MKRFWREVGVEAADAGWQVTLDGRTIRTARGLAQRIPTRALADAMAAEWAAQGEEFDAAAFPLRDLADYAIDIAGPQRDATVAELLAYAETDTLCYRAEPDEPLYQRQSEVWEPLLQAAEHRWDVHFTRISGVIHQSQPAATLARMGTVLLAESDFTLASLRTTASLAASLVIALAALARDADVESLWAAANLEEDWQAELWGWDADAEKLRARRLAGFAEAVRFAKLAG